MTRWLPPDAMTEKYLLGIVTGMATAVGLRWFHDPDSRENPSPPGFPDLVIVGPHGVLWRELKTEAGTMSEDQRNWGRALRAAGQNFAVWRPRDLTAGTITHALTELARAPQ